MYVSLAPSTELKVAFCEDSAKKLFLVGSLACMLAIVIVKLLIVGMPLMALVTVANSFISAALLVSLYMNWVVPYDTMYCFWKKSWLTLDS